jgi:hypothetical protein
VPSHPRPWHRGSLFGPGPRRPLDRNDRAKFRYLLDAHRRNRRLTPNGQLVGNALLKRAGTEGQCDPAHATLAADVGCSIRTVKRALMAMRSLGLILWQMRLVRVDWRVEQTSNAYALTPAEVLPSTECQNGPETISVLVKREPTKLTTAPEIDPVTARQALATIAARRINGIFNLS